MKLKVQLLGHAMRFKATSWRLDRVISSIRAWVNKGTARRTGLNLCCSECGTKNVDVAKYCCFCGNRLTAKEAVAQADGINTMVNWLQLFTGICMTVVSLLLFWTLSFGVGQ